MMTDGISVSSMLAPLSGGGASGATFTESAAKFQGAYERAATRIDSAGPSANTNPSSLLDPLLGLNSGSQSLAAQATKAMGADMKPSELMMLTMRSHEFLFNCQLVTNIANRSSDGLQQLFRQQS
jgi:hypothetical protein